MVNHFKNAMKKWKTQLPSNHTSGTITSRTIDANSEIFQGDSPSGLAFCISLIPLTWLINKTGLGYYIGRGHFLEQLTFHILFMDDLKLYISLLQTVRVFSMNIGIKFGLDKCRKSTILKEKSSKTEGIQLTSRENIKILHNVEFYKYPGIQESNLICHAATKKKQLMEEYFCCLRKVLKSKLNSINLITAINTWAISYGLINWTKTDINAIDTKTQNLRRKFHIVHNKANVERLYLPRNEGGRGLVSLWKRYQKTMLMLFITYIETIIHDSSNYF